MQSGSPGITSETAALVALLRTAARPAAIYADRLEEVGSARQMLEEQEGLLAEQLLGDAAAELVRWNAQGIQVVTLLDADYPENLRAVFDRPPLVFVEGRIKRRDARSVAVIGSRQASQPGLDRARTIAERLVRAGYTIVSGLAAGIDTAAHVTALELGARTIAVIGTGLEHAYPPQNAALQRRISTAGAVISPFRPEARPTRQSFPLRNAVMSGLSLATIVVEASHRSGARTQIRAALAHGRPVLLVSSLLEQPWARELATRPGVEVVRSLADLDGMLDRISATQKLVA